MNKRIIISESEKESILSQHKQTIKKESDLKKQSLSERELSNLVGRVLIKEQLEQIPGLPEGMEDCISKITTIKDNPKMQVKIAMACMSLDVEKCSKAIMDVGIEMGKKVLSNPMILVTFGNDAMNFAKCVGDKFGMDSMEIPVNNIASSRPQEMKEVISNQCSPACKFPQKCINGKCTTTTLSKEMKEVSSGKNVPCNSDKDCPSNMACYNKKCSVTSSAKEMKESEVNEIPSCPSGFTFCPPTKQCCRPGHRCTAQGCRRPFDNKPMPGVPPLNEEIDEIIYEIELDEEVNEGAPQGCLKCHYMGKQCCGKGTGHPKCCDYCGPNDVCGTRIKV